MQKFLKSFSASIGAVDLSKIISPGAEPEKGETLIGELPDELKKFYVLVDADTAELNKLRDGAYDRIVQLHVVGRENFAPADQKFMSECALAYKRHELIDALFWQAVKEAFSEVVLATGHIAIILRKNWQVVACSAQPRYSGIEFIPMFGLGGWARAVERGN